MSTIGDEVFVMREPPGGDYATLQIRLVDRVDAASLAALLTGLTGLYDTAVALARYRGETSELEPYALQITRLEIGTPNQLWLTGWRPAIKYLKEAIFVAAALCAIDGWRTADDEPPPAPVVIVVEQPSSLQWYRDLTEAGKPRDPSACFEDWEKAISKEIELRDLYMRGVITSEQFGRFRAELEAAKSKLLEGCSILETGGRAP